MTLHNFLKVTVFFILSLNLSCLENTFVIQVNPGGDFQFHYTGNGDQSDLEDADFPVPHGSDWTVTTEYDSTNKTYFYISQKNFKNSDEFPVNFFTSDTIYPPSLIRHPLKVKHYNWYFKEVYRFNWSFLTRNVESKYPGMANVLRDGKSESGWTAEAMEYLFTDCLRRTDTGFNKEPIIKADLERWLSESVHNLPDSLIEIYYDSLRTQGLTLLKQSMNSDESARADSIFKQLEDESLVTLGLIDDRFIVKLILPGELVDSNADTTLTDTLVWEFDVNDFHSKNYQMTASSQIIYPARYKLLFAILLIAVVTLIILMKKQRRHD